MVALIGKNTIKSIKLTLPEYVFAIEDASILHQTYFIIALHLLPILADIQ